MPRPASRFLVLNFQFLLIFCAVFVSPLAADQDPETVTTIEYLVDLEDAQNHYVTISVTVPTREAATELMMAVWTPGSYLVREYARHIDSMTVLSSDGTEIPFAKIRKNRWRVENGDAKSFTVSYRLYCKELSVRTNWVGKQFAVLNGAPTYLTVADRLDQPHQVELKMPAGWTRSATSLQASGDVPHSYRAENFDELVDSPIVAGNLNVYPFVAGGIEHQLVNVGESGYWDGSKAATDLKKMVEEQQRMWGVIPYQRYLFLNIIAESGGGLEHDNSTLIMTSRWNFRDPNRYRSWLSLASHEFFHTWNVRRLRPKSLVEYDYENEVYTESLWIAEGITSYYQDLMLVRSGLISESEYLTRLSRDIESTQSTSGREIQSLKESSFDTWIKFYRPDENSGNTRISYYSKGAVVAFLLDARIRKLTAGKHSLDDVMRKMFQQFSESGFTPSDFRQTASEVAGEDLSDWFRSAVDSTDELNFEDIIALGVEIRGVTPEQKSKPEESADKQEADQPPTSEDDKTTNDVVEADTDTNTETDTEKKPTAPKQPRPIPPKPEAPTKNPANDSSNGKPWLGVSTTSDDGKLTISRVTANSPATDAGLNTDDELIAINGFRVSSSIDSRLRQFKVGDEIELLIARRGELMTLPVIIGSQPVKNWKLRRIAKPTEPQKLQLKHWLGPPAETEPSEAAN